MAAYSTEPFVERADGAFVAEGDIECWRGSLEDLGEAAGWAIASLGNPDNNNGASVTVRVTYADGTQEEMQALEDLYQLAPEDRLADLAIIRIEVAAPSSQSGNDAAVALTARHKIPGILVRGEGANAALVQGTTDLMYQRLMSGYVDRYRFGLTMLLWFSLVGVLLLLLQFAGRYFASTASTDTIIGPLLLVILIVSFAIVVVVDNKRFLYVTEALTLVSPDHQPKPSALYTAYMRARNKRWVRCTFYVLTTVLLGVLSSKLADFIPFP